MKFLVSALLAGSAAAFTSSSFNGASVSQRIATKGSMSMETSEDLAVLAKKCNPIVGYFDPLGLSGQKFWDTTPEATIGFLRESEIKVRELQWFLTMEDSHNPENSPIVLFPLSSQSMVGWHKYYGDGALTRDDHLHNFAFSTSGRIAMFAFVGYIVHANGIHFPWAMEMDGTPFPEVSNAPEAWDSISDAAKWQIFGFVGFLEVVSIHERLFQ
jgi:hypothetical protein